MNNWFKEYLIELIDSLLWGVKWGIIAIGLLFLLLLTIKP
jgi:hypothetical protein